MRSLRRPNVVNLILSDEEIAQLRARADAEGLSMQGMIRLLIRHGKLATDKIEQE